MKFHREDGAMADHWNVDRFDQAISTGDRVCFASSDCLADGQIVYLASPEISELAIESEEHGLWVVRGERDPSGKGSRYADVILRE
ncbi:hypothetical protein GPA10_24950 [Streptomyces sp. p1417]|uniref:Uncharacterized protein n=1 Tax=Streptomyces typhae TaxID=2681492 RepID=A0A6L6X2L3_9ACTN|nr:hypothetical protein [Streptomyces typhae]MVO87917.1 hypothetical protein [Streptomyces typhae]